MDLHTRFAVQYLQERGIKLETALAEGIEICTSRILPRDLRLRLGFDTWDNRKSGLSELIEEAIWFPCVDANGTIRSYVLRPFPSLASKDGNTVKFLTARDADSYPFVPRKTWAAREKGNQPLVLTEGPCKALAVLDEGGLPISVGGVWLACKKNENGASELHPTILGNFLIRGRTVLLAFDADYARNPAVRQALIRTGILLHKAGAEVLVLTWPIQEGKGIDDYLARKNNGAMNPPGALKALSDSAGGLLASSGNAI
jgi:Domain of unknown function (DUF3854)